MSKVNIMAKVIEIANKREEVNLSKEQVELGVGQDIQKELSKIKKAISAIEKEETKIGSIVKTATAAIEKIEQTASDDLEKSRDVLDNNSDVRDGAVSVYTKAEAAAKDLGVSVNDIKGIKELEDAVGKLDSAYDSAKSDFVAAPF